MSKKLIVVALVVSGALVFVFSGAGDFLTLAYLKAAHSDAVAYAEANPFYASAGFFALYVLVTALSLPGAAVMTLAAGAIFGLVWGLGMVSFASTLGATLAMLISRTLLRDWVQGRFASQLRAVNEGFDTDGAFYLFSIRMVPLFPFFIVNLAMGLTRVSLWQYYWVSQVGMLAGTVVYVFAGTQLAGIEALGDVLSPGLIIALSLLGLFPLIARKSLGWIRSARKPADAS